MSINDHAYVKVRQLNHIIEIQWMEKRNRKTTIIRTGGNKYMVVSTGEKKSFSHKAENRSQSIESLKRTFSKIRDLVNNNFVGGPNELMITLTYAENMMDPKKLYTDTKAFYKRLRYHYGYFDYVQVIEPQARGAWHSHILLKFPKPIYIPNKRLGKIWVHGHTWVKRIKHVDNIGAYLTAYMTDIPVDNKSISDNPAIVNKNGKKILKGGRLELYPSGINLYRKSKGIKTPEDKFMPYHKAKKEYSLTDPTRSREYSLEVDGFSNTIVYEQYNKKRK